MAKQKKIKRFILGVGVAVVPNPGDYRFIGLVATKESDHSKPMTLNHGTGRIKAGERVRLVVEGPLPKSVKQ